MERREKHSKILAIFFIISILWILIQFLAPLNLPYGMVNDLSGNTIITENQNIINEIGFPWNVPYQLGDNLFHQRIERSFLINGNQMPFCSRCTAIWFGLTIGIGLIFFFKIELNEKFIYFIIFGLAPIAIDGTGQILGFWESNNIIRIITGLIAGVVTGMAIGFIIYEINTLNFNKIFFFKK
jgi:uncharacterized membrane protein